MEDDWDNMCETDEHRRRYCAPLTLASPRRSKLLWVIHHPREFIIKRSILRSPTFCSEATDKFGWQARLTCEVDNGKEYLMISIVADSQYCRWLEKHPINRQHKYSIPSINGKETYTKTFDVNEFRVWNPFIAMNEIADYVSLEKLTIVCEVISFSEPLLSPFQSDNYLGRHLFESRDFSDVTIVDLNKKEIPAHKAVLAAESNVFSAMFKTDMIENLTNRIEILDVKPEVLEEMLHFVYTGKTVKLDELAFDLLAAANKYDFQALKVICEWALERTISVENSVDVLIQADLHRAQTLKIMAIDFILSHFEEVKKTESYTTVAESYGCTLSELLERSLTK